MKATGTIDGLLVNIYGIDAEDIIDQFVSQLKIMLPYVEIEKEVLYEQLTQTGKCAIDEYQFNVGQTEIAIAEEA